jgi:phosphoglycolate phosphatase
MAHNAGADSLAISNGAHSVDTLAASKPLAIVDDLYQVEQWLNDL